MNLTERKLQLYIAQAGVCCYCEKPMLVPGDMTFKKFGQLYGLSVRSVKHRVATLEHLVRRADGGTRHRFNIALACQFCNSKRQETSWVLFKSERMGNRIPTELRS